MAERKVPGRKVTLMLDEEWRPVVGLEDLYEVSSHGRVRAKERQLRCGTGRGGFRTTYEKILQGYGDKEGYKIFDLYGTGRVKRSPVHRLMLEAFVGPAPTKAYVGRHLDDNKQNNQLCNLAWGTRRDNRLDANRNGSQSAGSAWAKKVGAKLRGRKRSLEVMARIVSTRKKKYDAKLKGSHHA
jgi:hypothetical protein